MIVRYLENSEHKKWDEFVDTSPQGFIFDYSWWVKVLTNDNFKICAVFDDDNLIVAGIILPYINSGYVVNTNLTQSQGILFEDMSKRNNMRLQKQITKQKEYTNMLWEVISKDFSHFMVSFNYHYNYWSPLFWKGCKQTTKYTFLINYDNYVPAEEFKRFSKGHKWILNKVEKKTDLRIVETDDVEDYLRESIKTYQRQGTKRPYTDEVVRALYTELKLRGMAKIFKIIDSEDRIHAVTLYIYDKKEVYYWLGASDAELRESGGHTYVVWYAIQYFADKVRTFNFGGSMMEAVEKNFRNFSASPIPYYVITYDKRSIFTKLAYRVKARFLKQ